MDTRFNSVSGDRPPTFDPKRSAEAARVTAPWNQISKIVFYPDRIYSARYGNAARSPRYQYNVLAVSGRADCTILKTEIYLDSNFLCNALRIEYRAGRLAEPVRERGRTLGHEVMARVGLAHRDGPAGMGRERNVKLVYDEHLHAYQVEIWDTLEPPPTASHSFEVLDQMGLHKPITAIPAFRSALRNIRFINAVTIAFRENDVDRPLNYRIDNPGWDDDHARSHQDPNRQDPSSSDNTVSDRYYFIDFQRGWVKDSNQVSRILYQNAMMEPSNVDYSRSTAPAPGTMDGSMNVLGVRWILQRELGGTMVYFHEVELPPGSIEGTHQHIGSEELYYFTEGEGIAYLGDGDDPSVDAAYPLVNPTPDIHGLGPKPCRAVPVRPGITLFTKSGGIHGVRNPPKNTQSLKFVAFGYHSA